MKQFLLICLSIIFCQLSAQKSNIVPSKINLKAKTITADTLYLFGKNHYSFNADLKIDSLAYEDENEFRIVKIDSNHFTIFCHRNESGQLIPTKALTLAAFGKDHKTWKFTIPCKVYPPVKVKFIFAGEVDINQNPIKNATLLST